MTIAFVDGRVFIGNGSILEHGNVVVEAERIVKVQKGQIKIPADARVIPLEGRTLLPGFIDCHVHVCLDGGPNATSTVLTEPLPITTLKAANFVRRTLMGGVTTIRDLGGNDGIDLGLKQAVQSGLIPGPRMLVSRRMICMTGGHAWPVGREADGPDDVRKAAREQIKDGADIVKFMATGGVLTPGVEPGSEQLSEEELRAGIQEAHKAGKKTAAHAMGTSGILNALRAGIDSIEHGDYLDEEAVSMMIEKNVPYIPTLSPLYHIETRGVEARIPAFVVEKSLKVKPHHLESFRMAKEKGVLIGMGTDAGTPFNMHGENLGELKLLVEWGLTSAEAMESGTRIAAHVLGLQDDIGTIEEGKLADLVVVEGNPLDNIELLVKRENIHLVMQGGRLVKDD